MDLRGRPFGGATASACGGRRAGDHGRVPAAGSFAPLTDIVGGGPFGLAPGEDDDTAMALCLARPVERKGSIRATRWNATCAGGARATCRAMAAASTSATRSRRAAPFRTARQPVCRRTEERYGGNGSLMRLAPVPLAFVHDRGARPPRRRDVAHHARRARAVAALPLLRGADARRAWRANRRKHCSPALCARAGAVGRRAARRPDRLPSLPGAFRRKAPPANPRQRLRRRTPWKRRCGRSPRPTPLPTARSRRSTSGTTRQPPARSTGSWPRLLRRDGDPGDLRRRAGPIRRDRNGWPPDLLAFAAAGEGKSRRRGGGGD